MEVYPDVVEEYKDKVMINPYGDAIGSELEDQYLGRYRKYLRRLIQNLIKKNPDFEHLFCIRLRDERGKVKQYVWVNLKKECSYNNPYDREVIEDSVKFWNKQAQSQIASAQKEIEIIDKLQNTPKETLDKMRNYMLLSFEYEQRVTDLIGVNLYRSQVSKKYYRWYRDNDTKVSKMIAELKAEGKLSERYKISKNKLKMLRRILVNELLSPHITHTLTKVPTESEIYNEAKEILVSHFVTGGARH
jgi:hypothetical protein